MNFPKLTPVRLGLSLLPALSLFGFAQTAAAEECGDVSCDVGFVCNTYDNGTDEPFYSCDRASCETDADCGELMVCGTFESFCGEIAISCVEGEDCVPPDQADCDSGEFKQCAPSWELPCEAAADCGPGFTCDSYEQCDCIDVTEDENGEITCNDCHQSEEKWCNVKSIECAADADCPDNWTCAEQWVGTCDEDSCTDEMGLRCQPPNVWGPTSGDPGLILAATDGAPIAESGVAEDGAVGEGAMGDGEVATLGDTPEETDEEAADLGAPEDDSPTRGDNAGDDADEAEVIDDEGSAADEAQDLNAAGEPSSSENGCSVASHTSRGAGLGFLALGLAALLSGRRRKLV